MKTNSEWMSISDMMSGLMLVFLFISISFMIQVQSDKDKMKDVAQSYKDTKVNLNEDLHSEFLEDMKKWDASITKDNTIVFHSPEVLFEVNKSAISEDFKAILDDFFPRYLKILISKKYKDNIQDMKVEGHTSNDWISSISKEKIYLKNMQLSQKRAYMVLSYCYSLDNDLVKQNRLWLEKYFRANGMAFAKLKYKDINSTIVDQKSSRRVEFSVQMKTEDKIYEVLKINNERR
ncbi:MAG: OmpA family protein [Campylobacteraceae bacterium]|nr:OmpA family protein [Campylobacteraceae bacterium]